MSLSSCQLHQRDEGSSPTASKPFHLLKHVRCVKWFQDNAGGKLGTCQVTFMNIWTRAYKKDFYHIDSHNYQFGNIVISISSGV